MDSARGIGNRVYGERRNEGSNPFLSARIPLEIGLFRYFAEGAFCGI